MRKYLLILPTILAACSGGDTGKKFEMPPVPVRMADVAVRDVPLYFEAMGTITPFQTAEVKPQVSGLIKAVHFTDGASVEVGDLLYSIDDASYAIRVQEAEAQLSQTLANLNNAKKRLQRYKSLSSHDAIAQVEWDELETKIALFEGMLKADEARLAGAQLDFKHCHIVAPIKGRAGKTALHAGNMVVEGAPLVTLSQENSLYVDFSITEQELQRLPMRTPKVEVYAAGGSECLASGQVTFLDHTIDAKSGMLAARALLTHTAQPLWAGQAVRVHLFFGIKDQAKLVPVKAIKTNQLGPYVYAVKEDGTAEVRTVKLGREEHGMVVVEEGLDAAAKVVTEGQSRLFPGSKVEVAQ